MRLTSYTDYTLRALLHLGSHRDRLITIQEIADLHAISKNHMMKVIYQLGLAGVIETVRGRNGGLRLKLEPHQINLGEIVRATETDFYMAACFDPEGLPCGLSGDCRLKQVLKDATRAYLDVLDHQTLADLLPEPRPARAEIKFHARKATAKTG